MKVAVFLLLAMFACEKNEHQLYREKMRASISFYEESPKFSDAGSDAAGALMELASDKSEKRFYRERALSLLREYPEERVFFFLSQWPPDEEPFLAVRAFASLAALSSREQVWEEAAKKIRSLNYPSMSEEAQLLSLPQPQKIKNK